MSKTDRWLTHIAIAGIAGTGVVYFWMRFMLQPVNEYAIINHSLQPHVLHLHVLTAPLSVFAIGFIWKTHIRKNRRNPESEKRRSGAMLYYSLIPMIVSGYLIQVVINEQGRTYSSWIHSATGLAFTVAFAWHGYRTMLSSR